MKRALLVFLFSICLCAQAWAFTLANVGTATSNTGGSTSVTTSSFNVAAGSFVYVIVADGAASLVGFGTVSDSNSNNYTASNAGDGIVNGFFFYYAGAQTGITVTYVSGNLTSVGCGISVFTIAGSNGTEDGVVPSGNSGTSASPTVTSNAPSVSGELFIAFTGNSKSSAPTFTQASGWTASPIASFSFTCLSSLLVCSVNAGYLTNAGSGAETYAPSYSASTQWYTAIDGIEPGAGVTKNCTLTLMGAGPC